MEIVPKARAIALAVVDDRKVVPVAGQVADDHRVAPVVDAARNKVGSVTGIKVDAVRSKVANATEIKVDAAHNRVVLVDALEHQPQLHHADPYDLVVLWNLAQQ